MFEGNQAPVCKVPRPRGRQEVSQGRPRDSQRPRPSDSVRPHRQLSWRSPAPSVPVRGVPRATGCGGSAGEGKEAGTRAPASRHPRENSCLRGYLSPNLCGLAPGECDRAASWGSCPGARPRASRPPLCSSPVVNNQLVTTAPPFLNAPRCVALDKRLKVSVPLKSHQEQEATRVVGRFGTKMG